jgi:hypothetical protein
MADQNAYSFPNACFELDLDLHKTDAFFCILVMRFPLQLSVKRIS